MGRIQSSIGLITGTPIEDTVNKLLAISAQPRDRLSTKVKGLQSQATSFSELTALVVGVQLAAGRFSDTKLFSGTKVTSSNDAALGVTKTGTPTAGDTAIRVLQLAQTHVVSSDSFASSSAALGQSGTLEVRSQGFIDSSKELKELNGGQGVQAGQIRITDRSGGTATIDISSARTVDDVLDAINQSSTVRVKARVDGDRFVIDDVSGGSGLLKISEVGSRHTAADLGFSNVAVSSNSVTGGDVLRLANATKVNSLRDGLGIGFNQSGNDLSITFRDGSTLDVDFSNFSRAAAVSTGTTNNSSPNGKLTISTSATGGADDGVQVVFVNDNSITQGNEQVELVNSGGAKKLVFRIDEGATTADDLVTALSGNSTLSSRFTAVAGGDGTGTIATTDTTTLAGGAAIAATKAPTLDDVLRVLNQASPSKLQAKIAASGDSIQLTDLTAGVGNFTIANSSGSTAPATWGSLRRSLRIRLQEPDSAADYVQFVLNRLPKWVLRL